MRQKERAMVKVVETVAVSESVRDGNEGVREVSLTERGEVRARWRCAGESPSQTNVCLSVPLGRHVSAPPD